jgi:fatty-acid desaturase
MRPPRFHRVACVETTRPAVQAVAGPWSRSWFYCAPGQVLTLVWVMVIHLAAICGLLLLPFPGWWTVAACGGLIWLGGLGTTIAYHRSLAHRSCVIHPVMRHILIFFAMFNGSGNPISWVADHRHHHASSDTEADVSSPREGFWWAHLRWLWQADRGSYQQVNPDLDKRPYRCWAQLQVPLLAIALLGGLALAPWTGWLAALSIALWVGPIRLIYALHVQCTVNSICHMGKPAGIQGSARNVWWLAALHVGQGENWHGNHHCWQTSPRLGYGLAQPDASWWIIKGLARLGLATQLKSTGHERASHRRSQP